MSSTPWKPWATKKPDADYDIVDFEYEIDDEDTDQQRVHEGQLLQRQPQARGKNVYIQAMSNLMKSASNAIPTSKQAAPGPAQKPKKLISHSEISTITPEIAGLLAAEVSRHTIVVKERTTKNLVSLNELLGRIPDGQTELRDLVRGICSNEEKLKIESEMMAEFAENLRTGYIRIKDGQWENIHGEY